MFLFEYSLLKFSIFFFTLLDVSSQWAEISPIYYFLFAIVHHTFSSNDQLRLFEQIAIALGFNRINDAVVFNFRKRTLYVVSIVSTFSNIFFLFSLRLISVYFQWLLCQLYYALSYSITKQKKIHRQRVVEKRPLKGNGNNYQSTLWYKSRGKAVSMSNYETSHHPCS